MSWNISTTGSFKGVKAYVANLLPGNLPPAMHVLINDSIDAIEREYGYQYNAVSLTTVGHGGNINSLKIEALKLAFDPVQGTIPATS